jgi:hypothetical protein
VEIPRKRPWIEVPSRCHLAIIIEMAAGEWLLQELLACNSRSAQVEAMEQLVAAQEEHTGALVHLAWGFGILVVVMSQQEYPGWDGVREQGVEGKEGEMGSRETVVKETGKEKEKEKQMGNETETEGADQVLVDKGKGKEVKIEVVVVEDESEAEVGGRDGVGGETMEAD